MIEWRPLLNAKNDLLPDYWEGFVGEAKVAIIQKAKPTPRRGKDGKPRVHTGPKPKGWQGEFFPLRAHFFRDELEEVQQTAEDYWKEFLTKTKLAAAEEGVWL